MITCRYDEAKRRVDKLEMENQETAERFRDAFGDGVIEVKKERGMIDSFYRLYFLHPAGKYFVRVKDARRDTVTRRVLELPEFDGLVKLGRVRDWFICTQLPCFSAIIVSDHLYQFLSNQQASIQLKIYSRSQSLYCETKFVALKQTWNDCRGSGKGPEIPVGLRWRGT